MRRFQGRSVLAVIGVVAAIAAGGAQVMAAKPGAGPRAGASIVGGGPANFANWEFMIALFGEVDGSPRFRCGGSVIAPTKVLTAAHCVFGIKAKELSVVVGRDRLTDTSTGDTIEVASYKIHPDYDDLATRHDFAVITLKGPTTQPAIALPTPEEAAAATTVGSRLRVAGWGARDPFGIRRPRFLILKKTAQRVLRTGRCVRAYSLHIFTPELMICALGRRAPRWSRLTRRIRPLIGGRIQTSPCRGDSGGPLVADTPGGRRQVGVVSFGSGVCGAHRFPAVYARVAADLAFIQGA